MAIGKSCNVFSAQQETEALLQRALVQASQLRCLLCRLENRGQQWNTNVHRSLQLITG